MKDKDKSIDIDNSTDKDIDNSTDKDIDNSTDKDKGKSTSIDKDKDKDKDKSTDKSNSIDKDKGNSIDRGKIKGTDKSIDKEQKVPSVVHEQRVGKIDKILKPELLPEFAKNDVNNEEPSQNLKDDGYRLGDIPTSSNFNWMFNNLHGWDRHYNGLTLDYVGVATWNGSENIYEVELLNDSAPATKSTIFYDKFFMLSLFFDSENVHGGEKLRFNLEGVTLDLPLYDRKGQRVQHGNIEEGYTTLLYSQTDNGFKIMDKTMSKLDSLIKHMGVVDTQLNAIIPTGSIITMSKDVVPDGYLSCEGATINRGTYADLFGVIGETYGAGDGSTTFKLPDFQGMFLRGHGGSGDHQTTDYGVKQEDTGRNASGDFRIWGDANSNGASIIDVTNGAMFLERNTGSINAGIEAHSIFTQTSHVKLDLSREWGSSHTAKEFRPVNYAVHYCIKY